jgi:hypothetical protein
MTDDRSEDCRRIARMGASEFLAAAEMVPDLARLPLQRQPVSRRPRSEVQAETDPSHGDRGSIVVMRLILRRLSKFFLQSLTR